VAKGKNDWVPYVVEYWYLLIAALIFFLLQGTVGTTEYDNAVLWAWIIGGGGFFVKFMMDSWINQTPKVVYNYGWTTTDGEVETGIGNFAGLRPALKAFGVYWKLKGALIFPEDGYIVEGPNVIIRCRMEETTLAQMPRVARDWIIENNIKPPYKVGYANISQYQEELDLKGNVMLKKPEVQYIIEELRKTNEENDMLRKMMANLRQDVEDKADWFKRIGQPKSVIQQIWDGATKEEET